VSDKTPSSAPRYLRVDRKQFFFEPLDVDRLIDDDHRARKIWRVVEQLDLSHFATEVPSSPANAPKNPNPFQQSQPRFVGSS